MNGGPNVQGTITAHHLWDTIEDAERDVFNFCKPVMKTPDGCLWKQLHSPSDTMKDREGTCRSRLFHTTVCYPQYVLGPLLTLLLHLLFFLDQSGS